MQGPGIDQYIFNSLCYKDEGNWILETSVDLHRAGYDY